LGLKGNHEPHDPYRPVGDGAKSLRLCPHDAWASVRQREGLGRLPGRTEAVGRRSRTQLRRGWGQHPRPHRQLPIGADLQPRPTRLRQGRCGRRLRQLPRETKLGPDRRRQGR